MSEWQPIETAPRDGTVVLLGRDVGEPWGFVRGYGHFEGKADELISGWLSYGLYDPPGNLGLGNPTHWMPLPAPPKDET